jgi:hypothetical protein
MSSRSDDREGVDGTAVDRRSPDDRDPGPAPDSGPDADRDRTGGDEGTDEAIWRFGVDDDGEVTEAERPPRPPLEPEPVELENALFVLVGVAGTLFVLLGAL